MYANYAMQSMDIIMIKVIRYKWRDTCCILCAYKLSLTSRLLRLNMTNSRVSLMCSLLNLEVRSRLFM